MKSITAVGYLTKDCEVVDSEKSSFVKFSKKVLYKPSSLLSLDFVSN